MSIPPEAEQVIQQHAETAVRKFRDAFNVVSSDKTHFQTVFNSVLLPYMREYFCDLGRMEFERLGKEHVRTVVLGVFDKFIEGKN